MPKVIGFDDSVKKKATCRNCSAIVEYVPKDVRNLHSGTDWSGGSDGADGFNCPNCGKEIYTRSW